MLLLKNNPPTPPARRPAGLSLAGMEPAGPGQPGPSGWEKLCLAISNPPGPAEPPPRHGSSAGDRGGVGGRQPPPAPQHLLTSGSDEGLR